MISAAVFTTGVVLLAGCGSGSTPTRASAAPADASVEAFSPTAVDDVLRGIAYSVNVNNPDGLTGDVFYTTGFSAAVDLDRTRGAAPQSPSQEPSRNSPAPQGGVSPGVRIMSKDGHLIWGWNAPAGKGTNNFRTQTLNGEPVLTWWVGSRVNGHGTGEDYIVDTHYHLIKTLTPGDGLSADAHEFRLTPDGHALITAYKEVTADLSSVGGPKDGQMYDCIATVVDVATGKPLSHWDALQHVPLTDSYVKYAPGRIWDPYHMNSIALDPAGNLVVSLRHTSTVFDVNPTSGQINWQLGGKQSTFHLADGVEFAFQHDAEMPDANTVTLFNNNSNSGTGGGGLSSLEWIHIDPVTHVATLVRNQTHPDQLVAGAMGNLQQIGRGNTFSGWGTAGHISEFGPAGELIYDVSLPGAGTYRAFFDNWQGTPQDNPILQIDGTTAHAQWNGATAVTQWKVLSGPDAGHLTPTALTIPATGADTTFTIPNQGLSYQVQALDHTGAVIGTTAAVTS
ncbi:hypothetical protein FK535_25035 [Mycolicibacterium sp. 018/SC-01/001]|nr:hypothetical protein FK535_25035 [Mycolicibacterium sp. 018/SC-01/001]